MKRIMFVSALAGSLGACGSAESGEFTTEDGSDGEYAIDSETGETSARIETPDGTATMRSGANVPVELPEGFSLYPGATVVSNTQVKQGDNAQVVLLSFESEDSPEAIAAHYKSEAEAAGVDIQVDATINGGRMLAGEGTDGSVFSINTTREDGKTSAQLTTGMKLGR